MKTTRMMVILVLTLVLSRDVANAGFTFGTPTNLGPTVNTGSEEINPEVSADGLELLFGAFRFGGYGQSDIWVSTRATTDDEWGAPVNVGSPVNSLYDEDGPSISADGLWLYFESDRPGGHGEPDDLWVSTRSTLSSPWGTPVNFGSTVNTSWREGDPAVSSNGLSLYFESDRPGGHGDRDLWVSTRSTLSDSWGTPVNLGSNVNTLYYDGDPEVSADGLMLFFNSNRPGGSGGFDIWVTRRATVDDDWRAPVNLGPIVNSVIGEGTPSVSADGRTLFYALNQSEWFISLDSDIWQVSIEPVVDLNGDGIVSAADICIVVDYWGTDEPLCDIGPMPWGDCIVDIQDLIVLAEHLFEDYRAIAQWKLDEVEGDIAYDTVNGHDATLHGEPRWQPDGGRFGGALNLDGMDDYIETDFILNPAIGSFSAFAWIKGGAPGHVMISQTGSNGGTWLGINPSNGSLMTGLGDTYFGVLESESVITDNQWHHIGLVYDFGALHRILYVDGAQVAEDATFVAPQPSSGGLHFGASKDLDTASLFSGLIDDIRIYNRAVSP